VLPRIVAATVEGSDTEQFMSLKERAAALLAGKAETRRTPEQTADWFTATSRRIWAEVAAAAGEIYAEEQQFGAHAVGFPQHWKEELGRLKEGLVKLDEKAKQEGPSHMAGVKGGGGAAGAGSGGDGESDGRLRGGWGGAALQAPDAARGLRQGADDVGCEDGVVQGGDPGWVC
jgi:hypothetical protein